jgi:hypothetical protein
MPAVAAYPTAESVEGQPSRCQPPPKLALHGCPPISQQTSHRSLQGGISPSASRKSRVPIPHHPPCYFKRCVLGEAVATASLAAGPNPLPRSVLFSASSCLCEFLDQSLVYLFYYCSLGLPLNVRRLSVRASHARAESISQPKRSAFPNSWPRKLHLSPMYLVCSSLDPDRSLDLFKA